MLQKPFSYNHCRYQAKLKSVVRMAITIFTVYRAGNINERVNNNESIGTLRSIKAYYERKYMTLKSHYGGKCLNKITQWSLHFHNWNLWFCLSFSFISATIIVICIAQQLLLMLSL